MNLKRLINKLLTTALFACCTTVAMSQVSVEQRIDSMEIFIGEQTRLKVTVRAQRGQRIELPSYQRSQVLTPGVEVVEQTDADTTLADNNMMEVSRSYMLTSFDDTLYYIPPLDVKVDGKIYHGKNLALKVLDVEVDTLHPNQFFGPKDVQDNPFDWSDWSPAFWLSVLLLLLCLTGYYFITRLRQGKPIVSRIRIIRHVPPHQKALSKIETIKREHLSSSENQKEYYTRLTDTLRQYIDERFGINAMEMTSDEILERLRKERDPQKLEELRDVFETADLVKFAKYSAMINENDMNLANVVEFIDQTKQSDQPMEERIAPNLSADDKRTLRSRRLLKWLIGITYAVALIVLAYIVWQITMLVV